MRFLWAVLIAPLPWRLKRHLGRLLLGWDVHPTAYVGPSLVDARKVTLGPHARIGPFNVIRHLEELTLEENARISSRNHISALPLALNVFTRNEDRHPALILRRHAAVTIDHELDCSDRIELGEYAALSGFRSQILTHNLDLIRDKFVTGPVVLGDRSFVMSGCILLSGTGVPARSIVSAGSVVTTRLTVEHRLYRGNPAEEVRELPANLRLFQREGMQSQIAEWMAESADTPADPAAPA